MPKSNLEKVAVCARCPRFSAGVRAPCDASRVNLVFSRIPLACEGILKRMCPSHQTSGNHPRFWLVAASKI